MYPPLRCCNSCIRRGIPCTRFRRNWAPNCSTCKQVHVQDRRATTSFRLLKSNTVLTVHDSIRIGTPAGPLKFLNPFLGKRFCNNMGPMPTGIVVLKNGTCSLMCSKSLVHNRLKDIVDVTLSCLSLSNHYKIKLVMTKTAPHHNGSTTEHFSLGNNVILTDPVHVGVKHMRIYP